MLAFVLDALTASQVGMWKTGPIVDQTHRDATAVAIFRWNPLVFIKGLSILNWAVIIYSGKEAVFCGNHDRLRDRGVLLCINYHKFTSIGNQHCMACQGRYERDEYRGTTSPIIAIDITERKSHRGMEANTETPIDRAAASAITARQAFDVIAGSKEVGPRQSVDASGARERDGPLVALTQTACLESCCQAPPAMPWTVRRHTSMKAARSVLYHLELYKLRRARLPLTLYAMRPSDATSSAPIPSQVVLFHSATVWVANWQGPNLF